MAFQPNFHPNRKKLQRIEIELSKSDPERSDTLNDLATCWIQGFSEALSSGDVASAMTHFYDPNNAPIKYPSNHDSDDTTVESHDVKVEKGNDFFSCPDTCFWRDMVAYTWNIVTMEGIEPIRTALTEVMDAGTTTETSWSLSQTPTPPTLVPYKQNGGESATNTHSLEFWCDIRTKVGSGQAHVRLLVDSSKIGMRAKDGIISKLERPLQATTLLTVLMELQERPFAIGKNRIRGQQQGPIKGRKYWPERLEEQHQTQQFQRQIEIDEGDQDRDQQKEEIPFWYVVVIGGGQAGLSLGARLQLLEIPYVIFESGETAGSAWKRRYPSLHLHDPVWYNHMPYIDFPQSWPILCPRDKVATFMECYAKLMDLNIKTSTKAISARQVQGENTKQLIWEVEIEISSATSTGETTIRKKVQASHVVFATGNSSRPKIPNILGQKDTFRGVQLHSSQYKGGRDYRDKRVVVIGSNNSGFDICQDLWEQGAKSVTMLQRSPSLVVSIDAVLKLGLGGLYRQDPQFHHEVADLIATTTPYKKLMKDRWPQVTRAANAMDRSLHDGLRKAGYEFDYGPNGTGLFAKSATQGGGFYINFGCAELLMSGDVGIEYATVDQLKSNGIVINPLKGEDDGAANDGKCGKGATNNSCDKQHLSKKEIPADVIVYATGFETLDAWVAEVCGSDVAKAVGRTWGLGWGQTKYDPGPWEGELRNMWKPTKVEGLWFQGGNLAQSRHYSRFLALQLAARYMRLDTPPFGIPEPTPPTDIQ